MSKKERDDAGLQRKLALLYLGGKCQECGSIENLQMHHKDGDPLNNNPTNIALLCSKDHAKANKAIGVSFAHPFNRSAPMASRNEHQASTVHIETNNLARKKWRSMCADLGLTYGKTLEHIIELYEVNPRLFKPAFS